MKRIATQMTREGAGLPDRGDRARATHSGTSASWTSCDEGIRQQDKRPCQPFRLSVIGRLPDALVEA